MPEIHQLPDHNPLTGYEYFPISQVIKAKKVSLNDIADWLKGLTIISFTGGSVHETGEIVHSVTLTWAYNKEILSQSISGIGELDPSTRSIVVTREIATNTTFTLSAIDGASNSASASTSVTFHYTPLVINSFTGGSNHVEGETVNTVTFNWAYNKDITSQSIDNGIGPLSTSTRSFTLNSQNITTNKTYTLTATDGTNSPTAKTYITFAYIPLQITAFTGGSANTGGQTITDFTLNWSYNKFITSQSINNGVGVIDPSLRSLPFTGQNITSNTSYVITATDGTTNPTATTSFTFTHIPLEIIYFNGGGVFPEGTVVDTITLTWAYSTNVYSQSINGVALDAADRTITLTNQNLTTNKTFTLVGYEYQGISVNATVSFVFSYETFAINTFTGGSTHNRGEVVTSIPFTWSYSKLNIISQSITDVGEIDPTLREYNLIGLNLTTGKTYTLTASDGVFTLTKSISIIYNYTPLTATFWGGGSYAVGSVVDVHMTWSYNKPITSQSLTGVPDLSIDARSYDILNYVVGAREQWDLRASDGFEPIIRSISVYPILSNYYGVSPNTSLTSGQVSSLSSEISTGRQQTRTFDCTGRRYFYIAYPASYGNGTFYVRGMYFSDLTLVQTTIGGIIYNVYRCNNIQTGSAIPVEVR
jgi:hypothetical protein